MSPFSLEKPADCQSPIDVVCCFMEWEEAVLFLEYSEDHPFPHTFAVPGGKVEPGETPEKALEREIEEELSLPSVDWSSVSFIQHVFMRRPKADYRLLLYKWKIKKPVSIKLNPKEHLSHVWQPLHAVPSLNLIPGQIHVFHVVYPKETG